MAAGAEAAPEAAMSAGALMAAGAAGAVAAWAGGWNLTTSGTTSRATMLMILISGFTAGPAVSL